MSGGTGRLGEDYTAQWLISRGYRITAKNFHSRYGEIDIIAEDEKYIVFVEVKTRSGRTAGEAREAVTPAKQGRLRRAATWYLAQTGLDCPCRFDVAEVYAPQGTDTHKPLIQLVENAF